MLRASALTVSPLRVRRDALPRLLDWQREASDHKDDMVAVVPERKRTALGWSGRTCCLFVDAPVCVCFRRGARHWLSQASICDASSRADPIVRSAWIAAIAWSPTES